MAPEDATVPDYLDLPLERFLEQVAARKPAPGGGVSAAVTVALAAALSSMSARFSADYLDEATALAKRAERLRDEVLPFARADTAAYGRVLEASRLPRDDEERRRSIREALSEAADVPLSIAEIGAEVIGIAAQLAAGGNPNLKGDAVTAVEPVSAGVRAATALVEINISSGGADDGRLARATEPLSETAAHSAAAHRV